MSVEPDLNSLEPAKESSRRIIPVLFLAGLVSGILGWLGGEAFHEFFPPTTVEVVMMGGAGGAVADGAAVAKASTKNAVIAFGLMAASLGLCLGTAGGLIRASSRNAIRGGLFGLIGGGLVGALAARALVPIFWAVWYAPKESSFDPDGMLLPMLINAGIWSAIGAFCASAFAIGLGGGRTAVGRAVMLGIVGALLGAVAFEVGSVLFFSTKATMHPIPPTAVGRGMARFLLGVFVALAVTGAAVPRRIRASIAK